MNRGISRAQVEDTDHEEGPLGGEGAVSGGGALPVTVPGAAVQPQEGCPMQGRHARRGPMCPRVAVHTQRPSTCATCCSSECDKCAAIKEIDDEICASETSGEAVSLALALDFTMVDANQTADVSSDSRRSEPVPVKYI